MPWRGSGRHFWLNFTDFTCLKLCHSFFSWNFKLDLVLVRVFLCNRKKYFLNMQIPTLNSYHSNYFYYQYNFYSTNFHYIAKKRHMFLLSVYYIHKFSNSESQHCTLFVPNKKHYYFLKQVGTQNNMNRTNFYNICIEKKMNW